jgi:hypothetical protein
MKCRILDMIVHFGLGETIMVMITVSAVTMCMVANILYVAAILSFVSRILIRHCSNCHCDWENEWQTEFGDVGESPLKRKFWG